MDYHQFYQKVSSTLPIGKILENPGGGTTLFVTYTGTKLVYRRGKADFRVSMVDLYQAYNDFRGKTVSSSDLKKYAPRIFAKKGGHDCNCTTLFMILKEIGVVAEIKGLGVRSSPFFVIIPQ